MGEDMQLGIAPCDHFAVPPDKSVAIVEWDKRHGKKTPVGLRIYDPNQMRVCHTAIQE